MTVETPRKDQFKIYLMEYERGWGNRCDEIKYFDTEDEAIIYRDKFNSKNTETIVPDWYMVAEGPYSVE
jgi:hypothetical protein